MRSLLALSLLLVVAHSNLAAQQAAGPAGTAGATRPNLKVLQQLPEAQLFPVMNLVATSLGVRCDFCHVQESPDLTKTPANVGGWNWARDDKPQKRKALAMMQMVVELNSARFRGEHRVTCYTCHQGTTQPARLPPLPPPAYGTGKTPAPTPLPSADRVWAAYVEAVGQGSRARGTGTIFSGWDDRSEGRYARIEAALTADRYRATLTTAEGTTSAGLDSAGAWVAANDRVQRFAHPTDVARMRRNAARFLAVKDRPANLRVVAIDRVAGRDVYVATARVDSVTTWAGYFDVVTGLLRREITTFETMLLPLMDQTDYDDYRDVNGVKLPFQMRAADGAPYSLVNRTFLQIRHNVAVPDSLLRPPTAR